MRAGAMILAALLYSAPALADSKLPAAHLANEQLADPRQEAKARALMDSIRCLVCEGQSVADSDAEMAGDMRALIRSRIAAGESPDAVRDWLVERYGQRISFAPDLGGSTLILWAAPLLLLAGLAWLLRGAFRKR